MKEQQHIVNEWQYVLIYLFAVMKYYMKLKWTCTFLMSSCKKHYKIHSVVQNFFKKKKWSPNVTESSVETPIF